MPVRHVFSLIVLGVLWTGLNALKPLQVDDTAYEYYARHMAAQPLDPYGFTVFWYEEPEPANEVLAPPVFPYSWALVRKLLGEEPWRWKAGLLPWTLLLVGAVYALFRRFASGLELECTCALVLSPLLLPSLNLMLDVPALALSLASVALFVRGCDRSSFALAALAGLLAGLAMQTKYTGGLAPGSMLLYALRAGKLRFWPAAALVAAQVFVTWELLTALLHGSSHFLLALTGDTGWLDHVVCFPLLLPYLGGVGGVGILMGLAALGVRRRWLLLGAGGLLAVYGAVALVPGRLIVTDHFAPFFGQPPRPAAKVELAEPLFYAIGLLGAVVMILVAHRLLHGTKNDLPSDPQQRDTRFLLAWLGLEILGYFMLTSFPALRRVLGLAVVLALLLGRLLARTCREGLCRRTFRSLVVANALLGLAFFALDTWGATLQQRGAEQAADWIASQPASAGETERARVWFTGHWGFQFYAERRGMRPLESGAALARGDWLVVPAGWLVHQHLILDLERLELAARLEIDGRVPLRTVPCFYGGRTPLGHHDEPGLEVRIYRVRAPFRPRSADVEARSFPLRPSTELTCFSPAALPAQSLPLVDTAEPLASGASGLQTGEGEASAMADVVACRAGWRSGTNTSARRCDCCAWNPMGEAAVFCGTSWRSCLSGVTIREVVPSPAVSLCPVGVGPLGVRYRHDAFQGPPPDFSRTSARRRAPAAGCAADTASSRCEAAASQPRRCLAANAA